VSNIALLTTNVHDHDAVTVLTVTGEVDLFTYPALQNSLTEVLETQPAALVLDLRAVTFYDPVGLDAIVDAYDVVSLTGDFAVVPTILSSIVPFGRWTSAMGSRCTRRSTRRSPAFAATDARC
jgi:anti-anti-sigma factor